MAVIIGQTSRAHPAASFAEVWWASSGAGVDSEVSLAGRVREAEVRLRLGESAAARTAFLDAVETAPIGPWVSRAYLGLAGARIAAGEPIAALELVQDGLERAAAVAEPSEELTADIASMRRQIAAGHRKHLREGGAWVSSSVATGVELKRPTALVARPDGEVVIVDRGLDSVLWLAPDGSVKRQSWRGAGHPFTADRGATVWTPVEGSLQRPGGAPRRPRGAVEYREIVAGAETDFGLFLLTDRPPALVRASPDLAVESSDELPDKSEIVDLDTDARGRAILVDRRNGRLLRTGETGLETLATGLDRPRAVAVGPFGFIHVLADDSRIVVLDPQGEKVSTLGPGLPGGRELRDATDLAVDGEGRLWIADPKSSSLVVLE